MDAIPFFTADAHLMVPIDFSEHSRMAVHVAAAMIRRIGVGRLTLLSVVESPKSGMRIQTAVLHTEMEEKASWRPHERARMEIPEIEVSQMVAVSGMAGEEICRQAAKRGVNMIQAVAKPMAANGGGKIVVVSSTAGHGFDSYAGVPYTASKWAVHGLLFTARAQLRAV